MLKFFRTTRKKLIDHPSKGRTGDNVRKYFFYAIGEILLVVFGILIALQVNNWNENRIQNNEQTNLLTRLKADFEIALVNIENVQTEAEQIMESRKALLNYSSGNSELELNSLQSLINTLILSGQMVDYNTTYTQAKSTGKLSLIKNEYLLDELTRLELTYDLYQNTKNMRMASGANPEMQEMFIRSEFLRNLDIHWGTNYSPMPHPDLLFHSESTHQLLTSPETYKRLGLIYLIEIIENNWLIRYKEILQSTLAEINKELGL